MIGRPHTRAAQTDYKPYLRLDLQLFADGGSGEKTEKATPKRRQEARNKGQVAKSMDLSAAALLLVSFLFFYWFGGMFRERVFRLFTRSLTDYMTWNLDRDSALAMFAQLTMDGLTLVAPIMAISVLVGLIVNYAQVGFLFTGEPLAPKLDKINPIPGFKRLFSLRSVVEMLKSVLKAGVVGIVVYTSLWGQRDTIMGLARMPVENMLAYAGHTVLLLGIKISVVLFVLAIFDYVYQKYEYEKGMKMSKQEIKEESKQQEGNPEVKGKIRQKQRALARQRMMQEVPKADVVITNPTHFAVAIRYDAENMQAPEVLAKGMDYLALKIKDVAREHGILTMENKPLARALYDQVEIGEQIPADLFQAVAEVLAYVYRLKGKTKVR